MDALPERNRFTKNNKMELSHHLGNICENIHACIELGRTRQDMIVAITGKPQEHLKNLKRISTELEYVDEEDVLRGDKDIREELKKCIAMLENIPENPTKVFEDSLKSVFHPLMDLVWL